MPGCLDALISSGPETVISVPYLGQNDRAGQLDRGSHRLVAERSNRSSKAVAEPSRRLVLGSIGVEQEEAFGGSGISQFQVEYGERVDRGIRTPSRDRASELHGIVCAQTMTYRLACCRYNN